MSIGTVKWFNSHKGFGFIAPVSGGCDLFVSQSEIKSGSKAPLKKRQRVRFEISRGMNGPSAVNVIPA
ncbi:MAG: cold shock domain-containing protein [Planctomycetes bacterium]|nr:cold shock domain-containing protein [Planctomycetota bacterium]